MRRRYNLLLAFMMIGTLLFAGLYGLADTRDVLAAPSSAMPESNLANSAAQLKVTGERVFLAMVPAAQAGPHGGYSPTTDECANCHRSHTAQSAQLLNSASSGNAFCYTCHNGTGASVPPVVSTHSNIDFGGRAEATFITACIQCHEPHGSINLSSIRELVKVQVSPEITTGPVIFLARTGPDSFDDGISSTATRICTTCHDNIDNSGYPMTNHIGGANHAGGTNYEGADCIECHPHSADNDLYTQDGFMPAGGSCIGCHATPQGTRRQIVDTGGDFSRTSHHVNGAVTDDDCIVCHDQSQHQGGTVLLYNVDNTSTVYTFTGPADGPNLEPFCLACHDSDGAGGLPPFSDSIMPPVIDQPAWLAASHYTVGNSCYNCHDNGHGSDKINLLAPWNFGGDGDADDPLKEEERFCYECHTGVESTFAPATRWVPDVSGANELLTLNDRHDIALTDQGTSGAKIECGDCHDPHVANASNKLVADPDPTDGRVPGSGYVTGATFMTDWCLDCHDGSLPPAVGEGHGETGLAQILSSLSSDSHGTAGGNASLKSGYGYGSDMLVQCTNCHTNHVSPVNQNLFHVTDTVMSADGSTPVPADSGAAYNLTDNSIKDPNINGFQWCNTCHINSMGEKKDNCFACHYHNTRW